MGYDSVGDTKRAHRPITNYVSSCRCCCLCNCRKQLAKSNVNRKNGNCSTRSSTKRERSTPAIIMRVAIILKQKHLWARTKNASSNVNGQEIKTYWGKKVNKNAGQGTAGRQARALAQWGAARERQRERERATLLACSLATLLIAPPLEWEQQRAGQTERGRERERIWGSYLIIAANVRT